MRKLTKPQDILLLMLAGVGDVFEEMRDPFMIMGKAYENMYGFIPRRYKRSNFTQSVMRSVKTGYIEKVERDGQLYLRLTPKGNTRVHRDFSLLSLASERWDGKWRVLFFDIEEVSKIRRNRLRSKLRELGFGMLQKSVWVTPHDILVDFYEFIQEMGLEENVFLIEGKELLAGDVKALARTVWRLDELNEKYRELEREIGKLKQLHATLNDRTITREAKSTAVLRQRLEKRKRTAKNAYVTLLSCDPHLPKELLPNDWSGERVRREVRLLTK